MFGTDLVSQKMVRDKRTIGVQGISKKKLTLGKRRQYGWIYCKNGGAENVYKCGFTTIGQTRKEAEKHLKKRYGTGDIGHTIYHVVPVSNAFDSEAILFAGLSRYRLDEGEFFKVDDVELIKYAMNILPF